MYGHLKKICPKVWAFSGKSMWHALGCECCSRNLQGRRQKEKQILTRNSIGLHLLIHINVVGILWGWRCVESPLPYKWGEKHVCWLPAPTLVSATMPIMAALAHYLSEVTCLGLVGFFPRSSGCYFFCVEPTSHPWTGLYDEVICKYLKPSVGRAKIANLFWSLARSWSNLRILLGLSYWISSLHT